MPEATSIHRYRRFRHWDYGRGASLFITIATSPRRACFGRVIGGKVELNELGQGVWAALEAMPLLNPGISVFGHVVMPDHVHFNVHIAAGLPEPLKVLGNAIRRFKNHTTKLAKHRILAKRSLQAKRSLAITTERCAALTAMSCAAITTNASLGGDGRAVQGCAVGSGDGRAVQGCAAGSGDGRAAQGCEAGSGDGRAVLGLWQQGYHDRLCLTRRFIDATERYIAYNPLKWTLMHTPGALRIHEPLDSPRLDADDYWKGVGNPDLLSLDRQIVALRVSRMVCTPAQIAAVVRRMESAVAAGYTILSGFISPGEKAVCEWLCANPKANFIRIRPSCIPNMRFKPESCFVAAFAANRFLEIGKGNDEVAFDREACLEYNEEIVKIATAGEGLALYWKVEGPVVTER